MTCTKCGAPLASDASFCDTCGAKVTKTKPEDPLLGRILLNQYIIKKKLGEGGFGSVYLAEQPSMGRQVAIKTLHSHLSKNESISARFRGEGTAASKLTHQSCVKMYNLGETEDGILWLAMEFLEGETLDARIRRTGALSPEQLTTIFGPICEALQEAHQKGIVHRDLKPDNIMLLPNEGHELPKLLDFGIAGLVDDDIVTQTGVISGTPRYMSPEQWKGLKFADARSDIYSMGMIAYQALTGRLPFEADTAPGWMQQHCLEPPLPLEKLNPKIPEPVRKAVMKAIEKDPAKRYERATDFSKALQQAITPQLPVVPNPDIELAPKKQKNQQALYVAAGGLPLIVLLAFLLWPNNKPKRQRPNPKTMAVSSQAPTSQPTSKPIAVQPVVSQPVASQPVTQPEKVTKKCTPSNSVGCAEECEERDGEACYEFANMYYTGSSVPKNLEQAALFCEKSCEYEFARGCNCVGLNYATGEGVAVDKEKAKVFYEKSCDGGYQAACSNLGAMYINEVNLIKAKEIFTKSCDNNGRESCTNLGVMYWFGTAGEINKEKATTLFQKGCDAGFLTACKYLKDGPSKP